MLKLVHLNSMLLEPGSVVTPGNWGRIVRDYKWAHGHAMREIMLEASRVRIRPEIPSRLDVIFLTPTEQAARNYCGDALMEGPDRQYTRHVAYLVDLVEPNAHAYLTKWRDVAPNVASPFNETWADKYWQDAMPLAEHASVHDLDLREVITTSPIRIVERLYLGF